jgi:hypothetical protein
MNPAIESSLACWHELIASGDTRRLRSLLAPDCVFRSPVAYVFLIAFLVISVSLAFSRYGGFFRAGVAGNADVITALLSLNQARTLRNDALAQYQAARVALARGMGAVRRIP